MFNRCSTFVVTAFTVVTIGLSLLTTGCGSDDAGGLAITGLSQIPSASGLLKGNAATSASLFTIDGQGIRAGLSLQQVIGTPPNLVDLDWDATALSQSDPDQIFWNGLVSTINGAGTATNDQAQKFWGQVDGGPAGQGGCYMAQSVGESVSRILSSSGSQCYMKEMSKNNPTFLTQGADTKIVRVNVTGQGDERPDMGVYIRVYGSNSTEGSAGYAVDLYFCNDGADKPDSYETIRSVTGSGVLTLKSYQNRVENEGTQVGVETITAYLTQDANGNVIFDPTKSRSAISHHTGSWGKFKGQIEIDGANQIIARRFNSYSFTDHNAASVTGNDYNYSMAAFDATVGLSDLKFTEGAFVGWNTSSGGNDHNYNGQMEFQTDHYVNTSSGSFNDNITAYINGNATAAFQADSFFSETSLSSTEVAAIIEANDCSATISAELDMDFSSSEVQAMQQVCEGERYDNYNLCRNDDVAAAENIVWRDGGL